MNHMVYALHTFPQIGTPKYVKLPELCQGRQTCSSVASLLPMGFTSTVLPHPILNAAPKNLLLPRTAFPLKPYSVRPHFQSTVSHHSRAAAIPAAGRVGSPIPWLPMFSLSVGLLLAWGPSLSSKFHASESGICLSCQQPWVFLPPLPCRTLTVL